MYACMYDLAICYCLYICSDIQTSVSLNYIYKLYKKHACYFFYYGAILSYCRDVNPLLITFASDTVTHLLENSIF